jgi:hypothetical protein
VNNRWNRAKVTVENENNGEIRLYQRDGTSPIPDTAVDVRIDYWTQYNSYDEQIMQQAVVCRAAHEVCNRFTTSDRVTMADVNSNKAIIMVSPWRYMDEYYRYVSQIRTPDMVGV